MRLLVGLILAILISFVSISRVYAEPEVPGCYYVIGWMYHQIEDPNNYLPNWRTVRFAHPEDGPEWAEGHFDSVPVLEGKRFEFVPDRHTIFSLLRLAYNISSNTASERATDEALQAVVDVAYKRGYGLGPGETIAYEQAISLLEDAGDLCLETGTAQIPTLEP